MPMKNPPHPGDLIRTEVIEALGLTVSKAEILKVRHATLSDLLHGKAARRKWLCASKRPSVRTWTTFSGCNSPMMWRKPERTRAASRSSDMPRLKPRIDSTRRAGGHPRVSCKGGRAAAGIHSLLL
jgi:hypothetical protein